MDIKEASVLGDSANSHWYYVSKAKVITCHLGQDVGKVLDVGAGMGWFSRWLLREGYASSAVCVDPNYEFEQTEKVGGKAIEFTRSVTKNDAKVVLMMDVLEHVDDDVDLLRQYAELVRPGTRILVTVPAFQFIWSGHDNFLEHRRRYTRGSLRRVVQLAGCEVDTLHYYFGSIFPAVAALRLATRNRAVDKSDMRPSPKPINEVLKAVLTAERAVMRANVFFGLSVVCLCHVKS